jgi:hypothetical protein
LFVPQKFSMAVPPEPVQQRPNSILRVVSSSP